MDAIEVIKKEGFRRRLSHRTIVSYCFCVKKFLIWTGKDAKRITKKDVRRYIEFLAEKGKSGSTLNLYLNSIKFLIEQIMHKNWRLNIRYSKKPKRLPVFLSRKELKELFCAIINDKHRLMVKLMYSAGLRVSELINLKVKDFDFGNNYGWVRKGKGRKDRLFIISGKLKMKLKEYIENKGLKNGSFIFCGQKNNHISDSTIRMIIKYAVKKANVEKRVTPHTLRHSFSTHVIQQGDDLISLQSLLGHSNPNTTMIYVHMAGPKMISVKSPYDNL